MNIDRSVIEQALDALEERYSDLLYDYAGPHRSNAFDADISALREALAQPQPVQQPVAHCELTKAGSIAFFDGRPMVMVGPVGNECHPHPLYTSPQAAQPLMEEPSPIFVLLAVEESIKNGECPWQIEQAFDEYEARRQSAITKGTT